MEMSLFQFALPTPRAPFDAEGELWYPARVEGVPGRVMLRIARGVDGAYVCTALVVDSPDAAITTSSLKNIHLARMVEHLLQSLQPGQDPASTQYPDPSAHGGFVMWDPTPTIEAKRPTRGGNGPTEANLAQFASTYREALNSPTDRRRPVEATAVALSIGVSTAHRWKRLCQQQGLLAAKGNAK